jgi:hypothetical protein
MKPNSVTPATVRLLDYTSHKPAGEVAAATRRKKTLYLYISYKITLKEYLLRCTLKIALNVHKNFSSN